MSMRVEAPIITMTFLRSSLVLTVAIVGSSSVVEGLHVTAPQHHVPVAPTSSRRDVLTNAAFIFAAGLTANQEAAHASTRGYHISRKLKAKEAELRETAPHQALPSGVAIQQFQSGRSGFEVKPGSFITAEIKMAGSPEVFSSEAVRSKFQVGTGKLLSGLEEGLLGMNLHGSRRIIVPEHVVKQGQEQGQLPLPQMTSQQLENWGAAAASALQYEVQIMGLSES